MVHRSPGIIQKGGIMARPQNSNIDWIAVETAYRANIKSLKVIGAEYGVSDAGIIKRAKRDGWERDLAAKIRQKAEAKVSAAAVSELVSAQKAVSEKEVIEANAQVQTDIILSHRTDVVRTRRLTMTLLEELEVATSDNELLRDLSRLMYSPDKNGVDKLNELYNKIIAMPGRVDSMKKLADTLKTLIALEREAFGIDAGKKEDGGAEAFLKRLAGANVDLS